MIALPFVVSFLTSRIGQTLLVAAVVWFGVIPYFEKQGEQKFAAKIERAQNAKIEKARVARRSVDGVPDERLRDQFFRD